MSLTLSGVITGSAVTGLTGPTYTLSADSAPTNPRGKKSVVTTLGGTQTDVGTHTVSSPFFITYTPPPTVRGLPTINPSTGLAMGTIPKNEYRFNFTEGAVPLAGLSPEMLFGEIRFRVPAGVETYSPARVRALVSLMSGWLVANATAIANELIPTGVS